MLDLRWYDKPIEGLHIDVKVDARHPRGDGQIPCQHAVFGTIPSKYHSGMEARFWDVAPPAARIDGRAYLGPFRAGGTLPGVEVPEGRIAIVLFEERWFTSEAGA